MARISFFFFLLFLTIPITAYAYCDDADILFPCSIEGELPTDQCDEPFIVAGEFCYTEVQFQPTEPGDCIEGLCNFSDADDGVNLQGARMIVDFYNMVVDIYSCGIEVFFQDNCGIGCTRILIYAVEWIGDGFEPTELVFEATNSSTGVVESISHIHYLENFRLVVSSCDAVVFEHYATWSYVPTQSISWGMVKNSY